MPQSLHSHNQQTHPCGHGYCCMVLQLTRVTSSVVHVRPKRGGKEDENQIPHASKEKALLSALVILARSFATHPECSGTDTVDCTHRRRRRHSFAAAVAHAFTSLHSHRQSRRRRA